MLFKNTSLASVCSQGPQHSAPETFCISKTPQAYPEMAFSLASGEREKAVRTYMEEMNNRQLLVASSEATSNTTSSRAISPANDPPNPSKYGDDGMSVFSFEM